MEGGPEILREALEKCLDASDADGKQISDQGNSAKSGFTLIGWCLPVFRSISLLCSSRTPLQYSARHDL